MLNWSTVLIARNEEKTLHLMISSLREFMQRGGEVIVVDTGSSDNTVGAAKALGCKVYEEGDRFRTTISADLKDKVNTFFSAELLKEGDTYFDYSAARNYAASLASNDMIAMPDCDEIYTKLDIDAIQTYINGGIDQFSYNFVFAHDEFGREAVKFTHSKFYNRTKMHWTGIVHEVLSGEGNTKFVDEDIIKLEHKQNQETNRSGYLVGLAIDCYLNQNNDRNAHYFGRELMYKGYPETAIKELKRHISISKWPEERGASMIYIGECYLKLGNDKEAIDWFHKSIQECSTRREPFMALATHYFKKEDHLQTAIWCSAALNIPLNGYFANTVSLYREVPHEMLYVAQYWLGNKEEGKYHLAKALSYVKKEKYLHDLRFFVNIPSIPV